MFKNNENKFQLFVDEVGASKTIVTISVVFLIAAPSIAWSFIYRDVKIVLDSLLILSAELFIIWNFRHFVRLFWIVICGMMILLEWNIFPESYLFYIRMLSTASGSQQGQSILLAIILLIAFVFLPSFKCTGRVRMGIALAAALLYSGAAFAKTTPWGRERLVWLRVPILRAMQVIQSDGGRFLSSSVLGSDQKVVTHRLYTLLKDKPAKDLPPKIFVGVFESWGESASNLQKLASMVNAKEQVVVEFGFNQFRGSTLPAEVRELCGKPLDFNGKQSWGDACMPRQLATKGFETSAFHGYDGFFYSRDIVYPGLGFQHSYFRPDLVTLPTCGGAFSGICDDAIATAAVKALAQPGRRFVYIMSLTAHEPVDVESLKRTYMLQHPLSMKGTDTQRANRALIMHLLRELRRSKNLLKGSLIYLVGDHNPPGVSDNSLFTPEQVPYLLIRIQ